MYKTETTTKEEGQTW